jgi:hypothetical protein
MRGEAKGEWRKDSCSRRVNEAEDVGKPASSRRRLQKAGSGETYKLTPKNGCE